ncbi:MAG: PAS domain S-box protein [Candidatus Omnitrophica bacterium]|nr:PAS domain S-box protein [Candidatus Omnitrophota bacterium]
MEEEIRKLQNIIIFKDLEIKTLQYQLEIFKKILAQFPGIIIVLEKNGFIEYINENGAKILGYHKDELIGKNWFEKCIPENIKEKLKFILYKIMEGYLEEYSYFENPVETKFKTQKLIGWRNNFIKDEKGNIIKVISYGIEISKENFKSERFDIFTRIFDLLPEAIHIIDKDYKILYFNETFRKWNDLLGFPTDVVGKNLFEVFPFLSEKVKKEYENVFETGGILTTKETNFLMGKEIKTETRKIPVFTRDKVTHIITFIRELTQFLNL